MLKREDAYVKKVEPSTVHVYKQVIRCFIQDWVRRVEREWDVGVVGVLGNHECLHGR